MASYYPTEDTFLNIGRGLVKDTFGEHKFGATPEISTSTQATIWDISDTLYPWSAFSSASILNVDAQEPADIGKKVTIVGLDANFEPQTEEVTIATSSNNNTTNTFIRVYRAYVSDSSDTNVGHISIQVGTTTVAMVRAFRAQTLMSIYTVPAGYTAYITHGAATVQAGADMTLGMYVRFGGTGAFRIGHQAEVSPNGYDYKFTVPLAIPEKSDIDVRGRANTNNIRATAAWDMILIKNPIGS